MKLHLVVVLREEEWGAATPCEINHVKNCDFRHSRAYAIFGSLIKQGKAVSSEGTSLRN
jgi:hypothetical protein